MATISMNQLELYKACSQGLELLNKTSESFNKINSSLEDTINSVQTDKINEDLRKLYDAITLMQLDLKKSSKLLNEFFLKQVQEYEKMAQTISEATEMVNNDLIK